ncbi:HD domain-containing protein [Streptomyces californicus]|uniref:HD domain-containing protein n=1 Tax=Streptomyces californicus TaxID=67351 RepID=UPI0036ED4420
MGGGFVSVAVSGSSGGAERAGVLHRRSVVDESVWGKARGLDPALPPYPLVRHLLDAAAMALHLWDVYLAENQRVRIADGMGLAGEPDRARALVGLCAGLHDIRPCTASRRPSAPPAAGHAGPSPRPPKRSSPSSLPRAARPDGWEARDQAVGRAGTVGQAPTCCAGAAHSPGSASGLGPPPLPRPEYGGLAHAARRGARAPAGSGPPRHRRRPLLGMLCYLRLPSIERRTHDLG